ncbi:MAG: hypothetical protein HFF44_09920 [Lawsonibacter sp.]|nr:hypothetical protein [Lawsonibacter sp.]
MRKKLLSLALALALCLGLTVPVFAMGSYTINGITATASPDGTINITGSGVLSEDHRKAVLELSYMVTEDKQIKTVEINIGAGIAYDENWSATVKEDFEEMFSSLGVNVVISDSAGQTVGGFTDVKKSDYFADPVLWATLNKITAGTSATTFSPNENCTVAQILSFLYRAYNSPKVSGSNPFSDVKSSDYYYNAALWAYGKGMVTGSTFGGDRPCTRAMAVTYMWQAAGGAWSASGEFKVSKSVIYGYNGNGGDVVIPDGITKIVDGFYGERLTSLTIPVSVTEVGVTAFGYNQNLTDVYYEGSKTQWDAIKVDENTGGDWAFGDTKPTIHYNSKMPEQKPVNTGFTDVSSTADYAQAVKWAVDKGVTAGTSDTTFSPDSVCTRGQIVTFLHRALAK